MKMVRRRNAASEQKFGKVHVWECRGEERAKRVVYGAKRGNLRVEVENVASQIWLFFQMLVTAHHTGLEQRKFVHMKIQLETRISRKSQNLWNSACCNIWKMHVF